MFGRKSRKTIQVTKLSSLVADNLAIVGDVNFTGGLRIDGRVDGNVVSEAGEQSLVVLSEKGHVVGRVRAYDAVVNGTVEGDLEVEHFLELQPGARITGNIRYRQLQMDCGATVEGQLVRVREDGEPKSLPAPGIDSADQAAAQRSPANAVAGRSVAPSRPERPLASASRSMNGAAPAEGRPATAPSRPAAGSGVRRPQPAAGAEQAATREAPRPPAAGSSGESAPSAPAVTSGVARSG